MLLCLLFSAFSGMEKEKVEWYLQGLTSLFVEPSLMSGLKVRAAQHNLGPKAKHLCRTFNM